MRVCLRVMLIVVMWTGALVELEGRVGDGKDSTGWWMSGSGGSVKGLRRALVHSLLILMMADSGSQITAQTGSKMSVRLFSFPPSLSSTN
jgi:hypothetical protein